MTGQATVLPAEDAGAIFVVVYFGRRPKCPIQPEVGGGGEAGERKKIIKVTAYRLKSNVRMVYELLKESNGWKRLSSISQESFDCAFESMHGERAKSEITCCITRVVSGLDMSVS